MKLNVMAFGLAIGLLWAAGLMIGAFWVMLQGGPADAGVLGLFYPGYAFTLPGALIGFVYGLLDGGIGGALLAWLYNLIADRMTRG